MTRATSFLVVLLCAHLNEIFQISEVVSSSAGGFSLKLIPRDHLMSPLYPGNLTKIDRIQRLNKFSERRISYLLSIITRNAIVQHTEMGIMLQHISSFYIGEVEIGDPPTTLYLLIDTGTDFTWTQCKPCKKCYKQSIPIYNSKDSSSLRKVSYDHSICSTTHSYFMNDSNRCLYDLKYADNSWTRGYLFSESFRVSSDIVLENLIFGCSRGSELGLNEDTKISGIMGLANSPVSILSQFPKVFQGMYAYCLRPYDDYSLDPFYLRFGDNIPVIPKVFRRTTKIITLPSQPHLMYLNLVDISVAKVRLQRSEDMFKIRNNGTGGLLIDSGCTIPRLDDTPGWDEPYSIVMASFQKHYDSRGLTRYTGHVEGYYKLCYNYGKDFVDYASMTYHFEGGTDYVVKKEFTNKFFFENDYFCVAIKAARGISVLGAWHQQNMQLIFDLNHNQLHFASNCTT